MLMDRRERPLGLGVCVCVCGVCVLAKSSLRGDSAAWAPRPAARGLPSAAAALLAPAVGLGSGASPPQPLSSAGVQ